MYAIFTVYLTMTCGAFDHSFCFQVDQHHPILGLTEVAQSEHFTVHKRTKTWMCTLPILFGRIVIACMLYDPFHNLDVAVTNGRMYCNLRRMRIGKPTLADDCTLAAHERNSLAHLSVTIKTTEAEKHLHNQHKVCIHSQYCDCEGGDAVW